MIEFRSCCLFTGYLTLYKTEEPPCKHSNMLMQYRNIPVYSADFIEEQKNGIISGFYKQQRSCGSVPGFSFTFLNSSKNSPIMVTNMLLLAL